MTRLSFNRSGRIVGKGTMAAVIAAAGVLYSTSAFALITKWDFKIDNGFTDFQTTCELPGGTGCTGGITGSSDNIFLRDSTDVIPVGGAPPGTFLGNPFGAGGASTHLSWGVGNSGPSSLDVGSNLGTPPGSTPGHVEGSAITNGGFVNTVSIQHNNITLFLNSVGLDTAVLSDVLHLQPVEVNGVPFAGPVLTAPALVFNVNFTETANDGVHDDDIFVIDVAGAGFVNGALVQALPDFGDGQHYLANIQFDGLRMLTSQECTLAGVTSGPCFGFTTHEGGLNTVQARFAITTVPEPGTLAVLGIGLLGLGYTRRRRKAA